MGSRYKIDIGDAQIHDPPKYQVDIGEPEFAPPQEFDPASETENPWQISVGDAQLDPLIDVNVGDAQMLGPNEFMLDDGTVASWDFGLPEIQQ